MGESSRGSRREAPRAAERPRCPECGAKLRWAHGMNGVLCCPDCEANRFYTDGSPWENAT